MRTFLMLAIVLIAAISPIKAAVPQLINYQGVLTDSTGAGLDTTVNITFGIYENAVGLTPIWVEAHSGVIVTGGLFSVLLGSITPLDVSIFGGTIRYLGITVGADPEMSPRTQLVSVPFSYQSEHADLAIYSDSAGAADILDSLSSEDFSRTGHSHGGGGGGGWTDDGTVVRLDASADSVGIGTTTPTEKLDVVGNLVVSGKVSIGPGHTLTGVSATITGGHDNTASGQESTVSGGHDNTASGQESTVSGGHINSAIGHDATVGGGFGNFANATASTISGGSLNIAVGRYSTVGGGKTNSADSNYATVGGGNGNTASGPWSTVGGGASNSANGDRATVGGGRNNRARGSYSVVAGGGGPSAFDSNSAIGDNSSIGGGRKNTASGLESTVSGGWLNTASGIRSTVGGGYQNTASGDYSVAIGSIAKAQHNGSIVIAANSSGLFSDSIASGGVEQLVIRADGGLYLTNTSEAAPFDPSKLITTRGGAYLSGNGTTWTNASDKNQKENFTDIDSEKLLEKISELPISRWNYKDEDETVTHIGPVAQDFYALFGVGNDDVSISTIDPAGIALAAIKELIEKNNYLEQDNKELNNRLEKLEKMIDELSKK
ncbi:MAG: tail fiber domain-containing protein [candidate division Zixibacteria bacterium]|nr:tail fiber domain-containing protein [candidate division Zixibacteria bacterium]